MGGIAVEKTVAKVGSTVKEYKNRSVFLGFVLTN
jgi:hypothetical protein